MKSDLYRQAFEHDRIESNKRRILRKLCRRVIKLAEDADYQAMFIEGPMTPTWKMMSENQLRKFFRASYKLAKTLLHDLERHKEAKNALGSSATDRE